MEVEDKLMELWQRLDTKTLAYVFSEYCKNELKASVLNCNEDAPPLQFNIYYAEGDSYSWNKCECNYAKDKWEWGEFDIHITLRKEAGSYLIIGEKDKRYFECDMQWVRTKNVIERDGWEMLPKVKAYMEPELSKFMAKHKKLFDALFNAVGITA